MSRIHSHDCRLRLAAEGKTEPCRRQRCAFWEAGGAVLEAGCLIDRLGVDVRQRDVAAYLLETREQLERARDLSEAEAAHAAFARRIYLEW
jgi:hypothetical protein